MSGLTLAAWIVGGIGLVFLAAGVALFVFGTRSAERERARIEALPPADAGTLAGLPPGSEVLVEGRLSAAQPALFRDFVAYERLERETGTDDEERRWSSRERRTPALRVEVTGGTVWVREGYALRGARWWQDPKVTGGRETGYSGLVAAERVVVVGQATQRRPAEQGGLPGPGLGPEVEAEFVAPGDRAGHLDRIASERSVSRWLGALFGGLGLLMLGLGGGLEALRRRSI